MSPNLFELYAIGSFGIAAIMLAATAYWHLAYAHRKRSRCCLACGYGVLDFPLCPECGLGSNNRRTVCRWRIKIVCSALLSALFLCIGTALKHWQYIILLFPTPTRLSWAASDSIWLSDLSPHIRTQLYEARFSEDHAAVVWRQLARIVVSPTASDESFHQCASILMTLGPSDQDHTSWKLFNYNLFSGVPNPIPSSISTAEIAAVSQRSSARAPSLVTHSARLAADHIAITYHLLAGEALDSYSEPLEDPSWHARKLHRRLSGSELAELRAMPRR